MIEFLYQCRAAFQSAFRLAAYSSMLNDSSGLEAFSELAVMGLMGRGALETVGFVDCGVEFASL
jgi:hypothetical protein